MTDPQAVLSTRTTEEPETVLSEVAAPAAGLLEAAGGPIPRARGPTGLLTHGGITIGQFFGTQVIGLSFPLAAGVLLYGWRALLVVGIVCISALGATIIWRRVGWRGQHLRYTHIFYLALLLALTLPAHLSADAYPYYNEFVAPWPAVIAAGVFLVAFVWLLGGMGSGRVSPVLVTYLLLFVSLRALLTPHFVLQKTHVLTGDLLKSADQGETPSLLEFAPAPTVKEAWNTVAQVAGFDSVRSEPASQRLTFFTTGLERPEGAFLSLEALLRDRMPPLEDLIIGGAPAPIGTGCAIAIIIGGLFLLYRGMIDYRIPLLIFISAYVAMLVLPIPVVIRAASRDWKWLAIRDPSVGWPLALTLVNYEVMASPLLFTAFFLATDPSVRPLPRRGRVVYAILIGIAAAAAQLYISVAIGPYVAMLAVSMLTPYLDRWFRARTLV